MVTCFRCSIPSKPSARATPPLEIVALMPSSLELKRSPPPCFRIPDPCCTQSKLLRVEERTLEIAVMMKEHGLQTLEEAEIDAIVAEIEAEKAAAEAAKKAPLKET
ncbi:hypothetical protein Nepgr_018208 [Nepenthes gracilis]|uniref:Uncharacterized protein n=1 Tax=Nepenthes gracilis TaxID=150966 RepID=A0AAD3STP3_NEPGR|nr:hypothetical protein Nepgr_018208 [Nepenthes gracilis]